MFCKKFKADFYFIQETHALIADYKFWKNQWGDDIWMSFGSNKSAGVAILKGKFKGKILSKAHIFGRWVILFVVVMDTLFILGNMYGVV